MQFRARTTRSAFTLIELLITMGVVGVLMGAIGGVIVLSVRAIPANQEGTQGVVEAAGALSRLASELRMAVKLNEGTSNSVDFTVPDRTGDGSDERIVYAWDGVDGGTITRTLNGGEAQVVATDVGSLDLSYRLAFTDTYSTGPWMAGAEAQLVNYDTGSPSETTLTSGKVVGMCVTPAVNSDAVCFAVTRVSMRFRNSGNNTDGRVRIQVRLADGAGLPTGTVLAEGTFNESTLSSSVSFVTLAMAGADGLAPGTQIAVIAMHDAGQEAASVGTFARAPLGTDRYVTSSNAGGAWTSSVTTSACLRVSCVVTTTTVSNTTRGVIERVSVHMRSSHSGSPDTHATIALANAPEVQ